MPIFLGTKEVVTLLKQFEAHCDVCGCETTHNSYEINKWFTVHGIGITRVGQPRYVICCDECEYRASRVAVAPDVKLGAPGTRQCPGCGETILAGAFACKYCDRVFTQAEVNEAIERAKGEVESADPGALRKKVQRGG